MLCNIYKIEYVVHNAVNFIIKLIGCNAVILQFETFLIRCNLTIEYIMHNAVTL